MKKLLSSFVLVFFASGLFPSSTGALNEYHAYAAHVAELGYIRKLHNAREYRVEDTMLRQELIVTLIRARQITTQKNYYCKDYFLDIQAQVPNSWICQYAELAYDHGLVPKRFIASREVVFMPEQKVSRIEALWTLLKAYDIPTSNTQNSYFLASSLSPWQKNVINTAYAHGFIKTTKDFQSHEYISRGEVFQMISHYHSERTTGDPYSGMILNSPSVADNQIMIPKLGKIVPLRDIDTSNVSGWDEIHEIFLQELTKGVVRYPGTVEPGSYGNAFILGHSSNYPWIKSPYNQVFSHIDELETDDPIVVSYGGKNYTYKVKEKIIIEPDDVSQIPADGSKKTLTLVTCWPRNSVEKRLLVIGEIEEE